MQWGCRLRKTAFTAPLYISLAWSLIISYQIFTQTAVYSVVDFLGNSWPSASGFLGSRIDTIAFIHAFAWIFVLSSVIPLLILGRGRSVLLQFFLCLTITFVAVSVEELLTLITGAEPTIQMQTLSVWFQNPLIAGFYLSAPYLLMIFLDIRSRKERREEENLDERKGIRREALLATQGVVDSAESQSKGRINFLHGASAVFFLLAIFTFWFSDIISGVFLTTSHKFVYIVLFLVLGVILIVLGFYSTSTQKQRFTYVSDEATPQQEIYERVKPPEKRTGEGSTEQPESLMEIQILQQHFEAQPQIKRYDVRHPRDIIDSQC